LYGLPGTGKTHLARVLAGELDAFLIAVSSADIESKWVGETEKAIKGLFNLAHALKPSIIFLDEADSLLRQRQPDDRSWEGDRVNQLLTEMDGLVQDEHAPFVLLASKFPNQLDSAVLRRASSRYYIRLPSAEARERMLRIFLREEKIEDESALRHIALKTKGYTGSDLHTLCVQTALACEVSPDGLDSSGFRTLRPSHFDLALNMTGKNCVWGRSGSYMRICKRLRSYRVEKDTQGR
jgi:SpoVK/Ycf46/Vps4 family AAA+-type ATPase